MINLIPNEQKKLMIRNFYYRLATVCILALGFCILIASITMLPSYVLVSGKSDLVNTKLDNEKTTPISLSDKEATNMLNDLDKRFTSIEKDQNSKFLISKRIIDQIVSEKNVDIKITQIILDNSPAGDKVISIRGTAPSRERLLFFRNVLEKNPSFKQVNLPISNFIKGSHIQFSLNLIPS